MSSIETVGYVQIEPQHSWHGEAVIRGNATGLRTLAAALLKAADSDAATTEVVFASDGEGYRIEVRRLERPDDYPMCFYTCEVEHHDYTSGGKEYCGMCNQPKRGRDSDNGTKSTTSMPVIDGVEK